MVRGGAFNVLGGVTSSLLFRSRDPSLLCHLFVAWLFFTDSADFLARLWCHAWRFCHGCARKQVLSVIAQQLLVLREGRLMGKPDINFMGVQIALKDHHVIITMNPGYAGRTELPDNLAVSFGAVFNTPLVLATLS